MNFIHENYFSVSIFVKNKEVLLKNIKELDIE